MKISIWHKILPVLQVDKLLKNRKAKQCTLAQYLSFQSIKFSILRVSFINDLKRGLNFHSILNQSTRRLQNQEKRLYFPIDENFQPAL